MKFLVVLLLISTPSVVYSYCNLPTTSINNSNTSRGTCTGTTLQPGSSCYPGCATGYQPSGAYTCDEYCTNPTHSVCQVTEVVTCDAKIEGTFSLSSDYNSVDGGAIQGHLMFTPTGSTTAKYVCDNGDTKMTYAIAEQICKSMGKNTVVSFRETVNVNNAEYSIENIRCDPGATSINECYWDAASSWCGSYDAYEFSCTSSSTCTYTTFKKFSDDNNGGDWDCAADNGLNCNLYSSNSKRVRGWWSSSGDLEYDFCVKEECENKKLTALGCDNDNYPYCDCEDCEIRNCSEPLGMPYGLAVFIYFVLLPLIGVCVIVAFIYCCCTGKCGNGGPRPQQHVQQAQMQQVQNNGGYMQGDQIEEKSDPASGKKYWVNHRTKQSTWTDPRVGAGTTVTVTV